MKIGDQNEETKPAKKKKRRKKKKQKEIYMHYKSSSEDEAVVMEQKLKMRQEYEEEQLKKMKDEDERKKRLAKEIEKEAGGYRDDEDTNSEMDFKEVEESETDEEDRKQLMVVEPEVEEETFATLRPETVDDKFFDAKKDLDSDSDLDEFGRLKDRQRPSSTLFDFLPDLKPDPRLDNGDITNCKNRLSRHVVIIREALARNERKWFWFYFFFLCGGYN